MIGGLEVVRRLRESKTVLRHPIEVFGFDLEESSPLGGTFGSRCMTGTVDTGAPNFEQNIRKFGWTVHGVESAKRDVSKFGCYLEYHIEQGDYLDHHQTDIGSGERYCWHCALYRSFNRFKQSCRYNNDEKQAGCPCCYE